MAEPLELFLLWNFLVQPHVQKFHWGLWPGAVASSHKLSSNFSQKLVFCKMLLRSSLRTSIVPQQLSLRESGISLHARQLFSRYQSSSCIYARSSSFQFLLLRATGSRQPSHLFGWSRRCSQPYHFQDVPEL